MFVCSISTMIQYTLPQHGVIIPSWENTVKHRLTTNIGFLVRCFLLRSFSIPLFLKLRVSMKRNFHSLNFVQKNSQIKKRKKYKLFLKYEKKKLIE